MIELFSISMIPVAPLLTLLAMLRISEYSQPIFPVIKSRAYMRVQLFSILMFVIALLGSFMGTELRFSFGPIVSFIVAIVVAFFERNKITHNKLLGTKEFLARNFVPCWIIPYSIDVSTYMLP